MEEIIKKKLLVGDKFMAEMYLRQPGFKYRACKPFSKSNKRVQKIKETGEKRIA